MKQLTRIIADERGATLLEYIILAGVMVEPTPRLLSVAPAAEVAAKPKLLEERSDDELMLLARVGIDRAFDVLVRRHQRRVLRVAARYLGENERARDVAQNTFVALLRAVPQYEARGQFTSFMYRLLLNQCRMSCRSEQSISRGLEGLRSGSDLDAQQVLSREHRRDVERALARLSDKLRDAVVLRFAAELNYEEIGETLRIPTGTAKRRIFAAKAQLRKLLGEE